MAYTPNVLFISLNRHQHQYFGVLGNYLKNSYRVFHVDYAMAELTSMFKAPQLPQGISFSEGEIKEIIKFLLIKAQYRDFGLLRQYMHSRRVLENQAYSAIRFFYDYIIKNNIDLVCVWNGTLVPLASAVRVAAKLGRKTLYFENGYLPNTTTVDPCGVNYCNSLVGKQRSFYDLIEIDQGKMSKFHETPIGIRTLKSKWYHGFLKRGPRGQPEQIELPKRYIFLPFQVHDDTQVLLHSPVIKTMFQLMDYAVQIVELYNRQSGDCLQIVVKEHPSDFGRIDYSRLKEKYRDSKVIFSRYYPTPDLIKNACGVMTINSSVGIESLLYHKQIFTIGKVFYNVEGLVHSINSLHPKDAVDIIGKINERTDDVLIDKFLYFLRYEYLAEGSWRQPSPEHLAAVKAKIVAVLN